MTSGGPSKLQRAFYRIAGKDERKCPICQTKLRRHDEPEMKHKPFICGTCGRFFK